MRTGFVARRILVVSVAVGLLGLTPLFTGCKSTVENEAGKRLNAMLPEILGPAQKYSTNVDADSAGAILRGRFRQVSIEGLGVIVNPKMTIDRLQLRFAEVEVDTKAKKLRSIGSATFSCSLSGENLNRYVVAQRPDINGLRASLTRDAIRIDAAPQDPFKLVAVPVAVEGKLIPHGAAKLDFRPDMAKVAALSIPRFALDFVEARLNPLVELSGLAVPVKVETATVKDGYLTITGTVEPDEILRLGNNLDSAATRSQ